MLTNLFIKNIAVIDKLNIDLHNGMSVLTGETGAGKSIIIDSINLILGARSNKSLVRYGEEKARVQAVFDINDELVKTLENEGIDCDDMQVVIMREITSDGRSICRINGVVVPASTLKEMSDKLINIHGQHDNQALLTPSKHIEFLDSYIRNDELKEEYKKQFYKAKETQNTIKTLSTDENERLQKIDLLKYQISEIEKIKPVENEDSELTEQRDIIANAEKITRGIDSAYTNLYDGNNDVQSAYDGISNAVNSLDSITSFDERILQISNRINDVMYIIEDCSRDLRDVLSGIEYDENTLNDIEDRLNNITRLKRKYGETIKDVLKFYENAQKELESIQTSDEQLEILQKQLSEEKAELMNIGKKLSTSRHDAGKRLEKLIEKSLLELDMPHSKFSVQITKGEKFLEDGIDVVEFMISTNIGEPLKPLVKIASGGELSRVMLAVKSILADSDNVDTLIFDEIDTGVSGSAAQKIAVKLMEIGRKKQVICISHLAQIASMADHQYLIEKNNDGNRVATSLNEVLGVDREHEIARIIDGNNITDTALIHAREMLENAKLLRERF